MSQQQPQQPQQPNSSEVQQPWKSSARGATYCKWEDLPDDIRALLKAQDGFKATIGQFQYSVKIYDDRSRVIFRNAASQKLFFSYGKKQQEQINEIRVLPLVQANTLLANGEYEIVGSDPVKVINQQFFVVLGKKIVGRN